MGGSAFSKALIKMEVASATGGEALEDFGKVAGMTGQQFKTLWDSDPAAAFEAFIVGLSKLDEERNTPLTPSAENPESTAASCRSTGVKTRTKPLFPWRFIRRYRLKRPAAVSLGYLPTGASIPPASPAGYSADDAEKTISGQITRGARIQTQTIPSGSAVRAKKQEMPNAGTRIYRSQC